MTNYQTEKRVARPARTPLPSYLVFISDCHRSASVLNKLTQASCTIQICVDLNWESGILGPALIPLSYIDRICTPPLASFPNDLTKLFGPPGTYKTEETPSFQPRAGCWIKWSWGCLLCTDSDTADGPSLWLRSEPSGQRDFLSNIMEKKNKSTKQHSLWKVPISILPKVKTTSKDKLVLWGQYELQHEPILMLTNTGIHCIFQNLSVYIKESYTEIITNGLSNLWNKQFKWLYIKIKSLSQTFDLISMAFFNQEGECSKKVGKDK